MTEQVYHGPAILHLSIGLRTWPIPVSRCHLREYPHSPRSIEAATTASAALRDLYRRWQARKDDDPRWDGTVSIPELSAVGLKVFVYHLPKPNEAGEANLVLMECS